MGSETETRDLEVKKAQTRNRSKQKQDKEDESTALQTNAESVPKTTEKTKKTRRGKRTAKRKGPLQDADSSESPKRPKKRSTNLEEKDEQNDDEDKNDDPKKPKEPSLRQIKREKAEQRESLKREASRLEAITKGLNYVSKWKHARSQWKFEKLRQIWLMDNLLDGEAIPDDMFPTVLEYFEGCKGMAREQLLKKGMDVIRKQEEKEDDAPEDAEISIEYKRARELLQALPTET